LEEMFANQRLFNTILIDAFCHSSKHIETGALDLLSTVECRSY